jgi:hypothetical protein
LVRIKAGLEEQCVADTSLPESCNNSILPTLRSPPCLPAKFAMIKKYFLSLLAWYTGLCLRFPLVVTSVQVLIMSALTAVTVLTGQLETVNYGGLEWLVKADPATREWFAATTVAQAATQYWGVAGQEQNSSQLVRSKPDYIISFVYQSDSESLFVPSVLESMRQVFTVSASGVRYVPDMYRRTPDTLTDGTTAACKLSTSTCC